MQRTVSSREAQSRFGSMIQWATEHEEGVVVERRGQPSAAIISYEAYEELARLRKMERRLQALQTLREVRQRLQERTTELDEREAYRLAGFGEQAIEDVLQNDQRLAES